MTTIELPAGSIRWRRWLRPIGIGAVAALVTAELVIGRSSLAAALQQLRMPHLGWLALVILAEVAAMSAYARMQRRLLHSAGVRSSYGDNLRLAYAAHSLNETLPGGPAFSTRLNYQQMRRFGASPAVASWAIALSGILSAAALATITAGVAFVSGGAASWVNLAVLLGTAAAIIAGVRHLVAHPGAAESLVRRPIAAVNRLRRRPAGEGHDRIAGFVDQLGAAKLRPAAGVAAGADALLNWLFDAAALWLCFRAAGEQSLSPLAVLLAFCAAMAAGSVTVVPGGLGVIDSALLIGLMAGGATLPAAIAVIVLYRIVSLGFIIGAGWLFWLQLRLRPGRPAAALPRRHVAPSHRRGPRTSARLLATCPRRTRETEATTEAPLVRQPG
ncbi:YbhN family protein [Winogradskya consettensis]|uniref:Membrane protein n=1 Tax=Winogradskya consettensis TaxID=113560 RepID=A0A919VRH7_9ACTN|nr:lysylphosphatidylglycerol synthase domain-containing protein [Actinoplanes consettensis]GIM76059.1 membrane protein [Actinoplanes consettensis]